MIGLGVMDLQQTRPGKRHSPQLLTNLHSRFSLLWWLSTSIFCEQGDIVTAYLNTEMKDEVYVRLPKVCNENPRKVRRLLKALYGHPKTGQLWNDQFVQFMLSLHFSQCSRDPCFFYNLQQNIFVVLYVDDLLAACSSSH